jgi:hypothetical protein
MTLQTLLSCALLLGSTAPSQTRGPNEPVWVPQAPPFGAIAALAGFPDLRSIRPVAGPVMTDVRVGDFSGLRQGPGRFLRLKQVGDKIEASLFLWWFGNIGPGEPPMDRNRRCTAPVEGPRVCVQPVWLEARDWRPLLRALLEASPCPQSRPTDQYELRLQVFDKGYRESDVCDPVAEEVGKLFAAIVP